MADRRNLEIPSGSPHDIAMMAYRIAERAMAQHDRHEKECSDRWGDQRVAMDELRRTALSNFQSGASDRSDIRQKLEGLEVRASSFLFRMGVGLITTLTAGLTGTVWWIITHPPH